MAANTKLPFGLSMGRSGDWSYSRTATVDPVTGQPVMNDQRQRGAGGDISGADGTVVDRTSTGAASTYRVRLSG